jgi:hypothetical protein
LSQAGSIPPPAGGPVLDAPVYAVTAFLHGLSIWGWRTSFELRDGEGNGFGSGKGLGRRGQIAMKGYSLADASGAVLLSVMPKDKAPVVMEGGREIGRIAKTRRGAGSLVKPAYVLSSPGGTLGEVSTDTHWANAWTVTDHEGSTVGTIATGITAPFSRSASCRTEVTQPLSLEFRKMLLGCTAELAVMRMRYKTQSHQR